MNALRIVFEDIVLGDIAVLGDLGTFLVTSAANERHFQRRDRRPRILYGIYVMVSVAIDAVRGQFIPPGSGLTVQRLRMKFLLLRMTCPALNMIHRRFVGKFRVFEVGMTVRTRKRTVDRSTKLLAIDKERNRTASTFRSQAFVAVARQAIIIADLRPRRGVHFQLQWKDENTCDR